MLEKVKRILLMSYNKISSGTVKSFKNYCVFSKALGEAVWFVLLVSFRTALSSVVRAFKFVWNSTERGRMFILNGLKYGGVMVVSPFLKAITAFSKLAVGVSAAKKEKGFPSAIRVFLSNFWVFLFGKNGFAVTLFNYTAPIVSVVFLVNVITYSTGISYAVKLDVNGQFLGYIENEQVFSDAELIIKDRLNSLGSSKHIDITPVFSIDKVGYSEMLTPYQIADLILSNSDISVAYAYGIMVDGELIGAVEDNTRVKQTLESILDKYRTGAPDEEVAFTSDINCDQTGFYIVDSIVDEEIIINTFSRMREEAKFYEVQDGDSHSLIAEKLGATIENLDELNEGFSEMKLAAGQEIKYSEDVPQFPVSITQTEVYEIYVPFETEYRDDATMYEDTEREYRKGVQGVRTVTARVTRVNGVETERSELKSVNNSLPVTQIILRGTKPSPENSHSTDSASYGKFIWPVSRSVGKISMYTVWDGGYAGHYGVDISAPYGTPIYAGASGKVVLSQHFYYDYGHTVIIEHANGLRTLYAHCSKLYVTAGEEVSQGQCIALVGQTGWAEGNHVHFEVRNGNVKYNPVNYLD